MTKGIDVSEWNKISSYVLAAKHIDFAIVREGCRQRADYRFFEHINGFRDAGVPVVGVYHFVYAINTEEAVLEADSCIDDLRRAGLTDVMVWCDVEYDTVASAEQRGIKLSNAALKRLAETFCHRIEEAGYKVGIYTNMDYIVNVYGTEIVNDYPIWLADYEGGPDVPCIYHQYSATGSIEGINGNVDMNYCYLGGEEGRTRDKIVSQAKIWIGKKESDGSYREIIDIYNAYRPLPRGYTVQYTDAWCATYISALAIYLGYTDIIPIECSCYYMIEGAKQMGIWVEDDAFVPQPGDIIMYDWQDSGSGDNAGTPDHVGMVIDVSGNAIDVVEGNYNNQVMVRTLSINGRYIRGYICPHYDAAEADPEEPEVNLIPGTCTVELKQFLQGAEDPQVKTIQRILNALGYVGADGYQLTVDGQLGPNTAHAIAVFQKDHGMTGINFGSVAERTWKYLLNA